MPFPYPNLDYIFSQFLLESVLIVPTLEPSDSFVASYSTVAKFYGDGYTLIALERKKEHNVLVT